ncbi:hypothetical protein ILUMI_00755, partial [Ignelater luminosus]
ANNGVKPPMEKYCYPECEEQVQKEKFTRCDKKHISMPRIQADYILLMDSKNSKRDERMYELEKKYEELVELAEENEGKIEHKVTTTIETSRNKAQEESNILYVIPVEIDEAGVNDIEKTCTRVEEIAEIMEKHKAMEEMVNINLERMKLVAGKGLEEIYVIKTCEYVFQDKNKKIEILTRTARAADGKRPDSRIKMGKEGAKTTTRRKPLVEEVIVKADGRNYADFVKTVKASVDVREVEVTVRNLKKTANGDLLLREDKMKAVKRNIPHMD